jgi:soluble lytic murein transglycosylase
MKLFAHIRMLAATAALAAVTAVATAHAATPLSKKDAETFASAYKDAERNHWASARRHAHWVSDPIAADIVDWMEMTRRGNNRRFSDFARFIEKHPEWPYRSALLRHAEAAMDAGIPDAEALKWFDTHPPSSTDGSIRLIAALMSTGQTKRAIPMIRETWIDGTFGRKQERRFRRTYGKYLTKDDHVSRLDSLLWRGLHSQAERMMPLVDEMHRRTGMARISMRAFSGGVDWHVNRTPEKLQNDLGFIYERVRWRRRKDRDADAYDLLKDVPADAPYAELWWTERSILARRLLTKGYISEAYRLAKANGLSEGARFAEAEWLSGWIALRYLREPDVAAKHFQALAEKVSYPISKARASYWLGRALEEAGDRTAAARHFAAAAKHGTTYYGQLAAARSGGRVDLRSADVPADREAAAAFEKDSRVRAARMLTQIGAKDLVRPFVDRLTAEAGTHHAYRLVAELGASLQRPDLSVRAARKAQIDGILLAEFAYPVIPLRNGTPEQALVHAIARQESNFDPRAISRAGARGLMQLMPGTAQSVARHLKVKFSGNRLTSDPAYNLRLGRAYLAQMLERFNGSYILSIAAYNAGPGAAGRWTREFGDPGDPSTDAIDWVEMIPYRETRNYVQRVLENLQIYRFRLEGPLLSEAIVKDLAR